MEDLVLKATRDFTRILSTKEIIEQYAELYWGGNGVGDRWARKKFNYSVIYSREKISLYSENEDDEIPAGLLEVFFRADHHLRRGIIGIFVHSLRLNTKGRAIGKKIRIQITSSSCVICGTTSTVCDHKNDLYNDPRVLDIKTQLLSDFQPLCNHCNLQKRQVCATEKINKKIYSAKNIQRYKSFCFEFPWEKKIFDENDKHCKMDTYWYDPVEFDRKIYQYLLSVVPVLKEIKSLHRIVGD